MKLSYCSLVEKNGLLNWNVVTQWEKKYPEVREKKNASRLGIYYILV